MSLRFPRLPRIAWVCLGLVALNVVLFAVYRLLFLAVVTQTSGTERAVVLLRGLRLDAALLGLEVFALGAVALVSRYARGPLLVGGLWTVTSLNLLVSGINLLFFHERNQHLWEMFFANLADPRDIWVALAPFLSRYPLRVSGLLLLTAGVLTLAVRHAHAAAGHRYDLWRRPLTIALTLATLFLLTLPTLNPVIVKRTLDRSNTELVILASRHQMLFDDYVLNQAVVNPLWELFREYLPTALTGSRPPYRMAPEEALRVAQGLLGVPEGDRPYPLLRTAPGGYRLGVRNVVVIQVEGLGTSVLEGDAPDGPLMPFVRKLAGEGLYFPNIYQSFPSTEGGMFVTLTSLHWTHALGGWDENLESVLGGYFGTLPRLTGRDYRHYAFSGFRHRTAEFVGFLRNQDYQAVGFEGLMARPGLRAADTGSLGVYDGPLLMEAATTLISSPGPFTAYVMTATSHSPWVVPAGTPVPPGDWHLGAFRYADDSIRVFVDRLRTDRADFDQTLLVITGDHTSKTFSRTFLERIRLPLILAGSPAARARGRWSPRQDRAASQVDVLPTVLSMLDGERPYSGMGQSLLETRTPRAGIISGDSTKSFYFKDGFLLRYQLHDGRAELLSVDQDDVGVSDLSARYPDVAARLTREFLALYETADRLMRDKRVFPRDGVGLTKSLVVDGAEVSQE